MFVTNYGRSKAHQGKNFIAKNQDFFVAIVYIFIDKRPQECYMLVEGETTPNPVCKNKFSRNVTRTNCCCTGVGVAYSSECRLCPKRESSKLHLKYDCKCNENVMSCHVMSCHVISCHVMSCHVM